MTDLVKKYQHYFNESVKLQETVNEQLAYIVELEEAIIALDEVQRMTPARQAVLDDEMKTAQRVIDDSMEKEYESGMTNSEHGLAGKALDRKYRINKIKNKTVQEAKQADDEHGTVARVGRITKFLEKHPDASKMKAHHLNTFFNHPDYFGETDEASDVAMKKLPVHHRKTIRAMRKDHYDREW